MGLLKRKHAPQKGFAQSIQEDKHMRMARHALHDMFDFYDELTTEIARFEAVPQKNRFEQEIYNHMCSVKECYHNAMRDIRHDAEDVRQHALICFSDALLDLMKSIHRQKAEL